MRESEDPRVPRTVGREKRSTDVSTKGQKNTPRRLDFGLFTHTVRPFLLRRFLTGSLDPWLQVPSGADRVCTPFEARRSTVGCVVQDRILETTQGRGRPPTGPTPEGRDEI